RWAASLVVRCSRCRHIFCDQRLCDGSYDCPNIWRTASCVRFFAAPLFPNYAAVLVRNRAISARVLGCVCVSPTQDRRGKLSSNFAGPYHSVSALGSRRQPSHCWRRVVSVVRDFLLLTFRACVGLQSECRPAAYSSHAGLGFDWLLSQQELASVRNDHRADAPGISGRCDYWKHGGP